MLRAEHVVLLVSVWRVLWVVTSPIPLLACFIRILNQVCQCPKAVSPVMGTDSLAGGDTSISDSAAAAASTEPLLRRVWLTVAASMPPPNMSINFCNSPSAGSPAIGRQSIMPGDVVAWREG